MKELIVYFCDDLINIVYNKEVIVKKFKSLEDGFIKDRSLFMEEFLEMLKTEKIKSKLFGEQIYVVREPYFYNAHIYFLDNLFMDIGFIKVKYLNIKDLFLDYGTYIGIFKNYMIMYLERPIVLDLKYFGKLEDNINYFKDYLQDSVILFGSNELIKDIKSDLVMIYFIDNYQNYITQSLLKVKKYDK